MSLRTLSKLTAAALPCTVSSYIELPGLRCIELPQQHPVGGVGVAWSDALLDDAKEICDTGDGCTGVMRYTGSQESHCHDWCGRPQFCMVNVEEDGSFPFSPNAAWTSYVKSDYLESLGISPAYLRSTLGANTDMPAAKALQPEEHARPVDCSDFGHKPWDGPPVVLISTELASEAASRGSPPFPGACHVMYQPADVPVHWLTSEKSSFVDGILSEHEDEVLPVFSASAPDQDFSPGSAPPGTPHRYFFDPVPEFPDVVPGSKKYILSVYFLSPESFCSGPEGAQLSPASVRSELGGRHVYVEDGTHHTREAAFRNYHFTMFCGDFSKQLFPPLALIYSLAYVAHAMVPEFVHWKASRMFFHLPDAAQGVRSMQIAGLEGYLENLIMNPKKEKMMEFKQTFTLLSQTLFRYRYKENATKRAEVAACAACDAKHRESNRNSVAKSLRAGSTGAVADAAVAVVFCVMSRRSASGLRQVVRDTWGQGLADKAPTVVQRFFVGKAANATHVLHDSNVGDVVELPVVESYRTLNLKAFAMLTWAHSSYPNLQWLVRHDDDVYLRAPALLAQLAHRPPVRYVWGLFDHGSSPVRDPEHQHYNSYKQFPEQTHPAWGDIFPPYARGLLWAMSADLVAHVVADFIEDIKTQPGILDEAAAELLPHPDDPAVGVVLTTLVKEGMSVNLDDRDFNSFSLNPSCNSTFSNIHNRTWVVHHVKPDTMRCMWELDSAEAVSNVASRNSAIDASNRLFPDLCLCSTEVVEEEDGEEEPFWYDRQRFNSAR